MNLVGEVVGKFFFTDTSGKAKIGILMRQSLLSTCLFKGKQVRFSRFCSLFGSILVYFFTVSNKLSRVKQKVQLCL